MAFRDRFFGVVASAVGVSTVSMGLAFFRQLLIAAYFGISRDLEIFLIVYSVCNWIAFAFASIFDSVMVPNLIRLRETEGAEASRILAVQLFRISGLLGLVGAVVLVVAMPLLAPIVATGFNAVEQEGLASLTWYFLPWIFFCLPYYATSARHKSEWRFNRVFVAEIIVAVVSILFLVLFHGAVRFLPLAYGAGYGAGVLWMLPGAGLIRGSARSPAVKRTLRNIGELYGANQTGTVLGIVDRHFQSLTPVGGIAAIGYAGQLVNALSNLLSMREIFIVPLSATAGRAERLERLIIGLILVSIPIASIVAFFAPEIVHILFQRGKFDEAAAATTASVLRIYIFTLIPAAFATPLARMFQIIDRIRLLYVYYLALALFYVAFGVLFVGTLGLGVQGVVWMYLASSAPGVLLLAYLIHRCGVHLRWRRILQYFIFAAVISALSYIAATFAAAPWSGPWSRIFTGGPAFAAVTVIAYYLVRLRLMRILS